MNLRKLLGLCNHEFDEAKMFNIKDEANITKAIVVMITCKHCGKVKLTKIRAKL